VFVFFVFFVVVSRLKALLGQNRFLFAYSLLFKSAETNSLSLRKNSLKLSLMKKIVCSLSLRKTNCS